METFGEYTGNYPFEVIETTNEVPCVACFRTLEETQEHCEKLMDNVKVDIIDKLSGCEFHFD